MVCNSYNFGNVFLGIVVNLIIMGEMKIVLICVGIMENGMICLVTLKDFLFVSLYEF